MYVEGVFTSVIAQWTGGLWLPLVARGDGTAILDMVEYNGDLVIGGDFSSLGNNIAAWDGAVWHSFEGGVDDTVWDLHVFHGELVVLGEFLQANGQPSAFIASWMSPTPVMVLDFKASRSRDGTYLSWRLNSAEKEQWSEVEVQRSASIEGAYASISSAVNATVDGEYYDATALSQLDYWYRLLVRGRDGQVEFSNPVISRGGGWLETQLFPPIPGGEVVRLRYLLSTHSAAVRLGIYDVRGRLVRVLHSGDQSPGDYDLSWGRVADSGRRVGPGVYFVRLGVDSRWYVQKFVLLP
jgi:hypothetical protein